MSAIVGLVIIGIVMGFLFHLSINILIGKTVAFLIKTAFPRLCVSSTIGAFTLPAIHTQFDIEKEIRGAQSVALEIVLVSLAIDLIFWFSMDMFSSHNSKSIGGSHIEKVEAMDIEHTSQGDDEGETVIKEDVDKQEVVAINKVS